MLLAIDAGNTNIVFAVHDGNEFVHIWRCQTISGRTSDEYASWLHQLFSQTTLQFSDITDAIISSVVPDANMNLSNFCRKSFGCEALMITHHDVDLAIKLDKPSEIGADRLVNSVAVKNHYQFPAIVIDFGTATTFDVIDADGAYIGGVIAPGINLSMVALYEAAAKLPKINVKKTQSVIGHDTVSAMQSGVYWGYVGMIEGTIKRIAEEMDVEPKIIATGGLAHLFSESIPSIEIIDDDLTLRGLYDIYQCKQQSIMAA
jgi:type III pantothenate kinase